MKLNLTKLVLTAGLSLGIISVASVAEAGINLNGSSLTGHLPQPTTKWQPQQSKALTAKGSSLTGQKTDKQTQQQLQKHPEVIDVLAENENSRTEGYGDIRKLTQSQT